MPRIRVLTATSAFATLVCVCLAAAPAPSASASYDVPRRATGVLPAGFAAQSLTWTSPKDGWALGNAQCGNETCTTVIRTTDGGTKWTTVGTIDAPIREHKPSGVTGIRFADGQHGWAFGPSLQVSDDRGATWDPAAIPGGGLQVLALVADPQVAYAVVSPCGPRARRCHHRATLWRTSPGSGGWDQVSLKLERAGVVSLALHGTVAYVAMQSYAPDPGVFFATTDGADWSPRPNPCRVDLSYAIVDVAPISDAGVAILCVGDGGAGSAGKQVYRSSDTAKTTTSAGKPPLPGIGRCSRPRGKARSWSCRGRSRI